MLLPILTDPTAPVGCKNAFSNFDSVQSTIVCHRCAERCTCTCGFCRRMPLCNGCCACSAKVLVSLRVIVGPFGQHACWLERQAASHHKHCSAQTEPHTIEAVRFRCRILSVILLLVVTVRQQANARELRSATLRRLKNAQLPAGCNLPEGVHLPPLPGDFHLPEWFCLPADSSDPAPGPTPLPAISNQPVVTNANGRNVVVSFCKATSNSTSATDGAGALVIASARPCGRTAWLATKQMSLRYHADCSPATYSSHSVHKSQRHHGWRNLLLCWPD
jgi:hypothetical protein